MGQVAQRVANHATVTGNVPKTWITRFPDTQGDAIPESIIGDYSATLLGEAGAPALAGTNKYDDAFPAKDPDILYWFRSDMTNKMVFESGSPQGGGTVNAFASPVGIQAAILDTATSGDLALDFFPNRRGFPSLRGGDSGTPKSLWSTNNLAYGSGIGSQRLFWAVVGWNESSGSQCGCGWHSNISFPTTYSSYNGDLVPGRNVPVNYIGGVSVGQAYLPMSYADSSKGLHIILQRVTIQAGVVNPTHALVESWYNGVKHPTRESNTASNISGRCSIGALSTSNFDSDADFYEMGAISRVGAVTDQTVEDITRYLCNHYNIDFMPDTTPLDLSIRNVSAFKIQNEMPFHYRADKVSAALGDDINTWENNPDIEAANGFSAGDAVSPGLVGPRLSKAGLDRRFGRFEVADLTDIKVADNYQWNESTVFPLPAGYTSFVLTTMEALTNASGYLHNLGPGTSEPRRNSTAATLQIRVASQSVNTVNPYVDTGPMLVITSYDYTDTTSLTWVFGQLTSEYMVNANPTATGTSNVRPTIGHNNSSNRLEGDLWESGHLKSRFDIAKAEALRRYIEYRYNVKFADIVYP